MKITVVGASLIGLAAALAIWILWYFIPEQKNKANGSGGVA